jgi:hypothetical protein
MAFQTGTKVDPRLMQADYSGFANAASIQAEAMKDLGQQIGGAIKEYSKKKEEKQLTSKTAEWLLAQPGASDIGITDLATAQVAIKSMGGVAQALNSIGVFKQNQRLDRVEARQDELQPGRVKGQDVNIAATEANIARTRLATEQSESAFPTEQALREQSLRGAQQDYDQSASMFDPQLAMANLGVQTAQQAYDQNEAMNPLRLDRQSIMNQNALQAFDIAGQNEMRAAGMYPVDLRGKQQNIATSIASINNAEKTLDLENRKMKLLEEQANADSTNAQVQANMIQMVLDGDMSNKEYINAGGDMDTLRKATELTEGQTARGNADMIAAVKEVNDNLRYNPETNDWTDTSGINEDGIQWSDPRIQNILGTRESQVMGNAGWSIPGNTSN